MKCRFCQHSPLRPFIDLGSAPPSNALLTAQALSAPETWYPLRVVVCEACWLVQTEDFASSEEFFNASYPYFSSYSSSWLKHAERFVEAMVERFSMNHGSHVVEVAANDGYLLQYVRAQGIPCTGIEPTKNTAAVARSKDIPIIEEFFGRNLAEALALQGRQADLTVANNVLAHVPDINDFVAGFTKLLKPAGVATFEFPHLLRLINENQFDTIYHEHFSYLSLSAVEQIFQANGLAVFDVEELPTHGGSLRIFAQRLDTGTHDRAPAVDAILERETLHGLCSPEGYAGFQQKAEWIKDELLRFLLQAKREGKTVGAYGAAAKGNTLLNFAGVRPDLLSCVADRSTAKQESYLPGSRIPIVDEARLAQLQPDYVLILPWNLKDEILGQLGYLRDQGTRFVTAIPSLQIV